MTIEASIQQAFTLLKTKNFKEALTAYQLILKQDASREDIWHAGAIALVQLGEKRKALKYLYKAIKLSPEHPVILNTLGNIHMSEKDYDKALEIFNEALSIDPNYLTVYNNIGNCLFHQHNYQQAKIYYQKAIALSPRSVTAYYHLARLLIIENDQEAAITLLMQALNYQPTHVSILRQLAHIYLFQNNLSEAVRYYEQIITLDAHNANAYYDCGIAYLKNKAYKKSIQAFQQTLTLHPKHPDCHFYLASAYLQAGQFDAARQHYLCQLEYSPNSTCYYNIAVLFMHEEKHKTALAYFEEAIKQEPNYYEAYVNMGAIYLKYNQLPKAIHSYKQAQLLKPEESEINFILNALLQTDSPTKAPTSYIQNLFNQYAPYYDKHLMEYLSYTAPQLLYDLIARHSADTPSHAWTILDLGCGTGLCGYYFKPLANQLIGIDLSSNMINSAKQKNIYDKLEENDIMEALDKYQAIDLVIAADVLTYIGDLTPLFEKVKRSLKKNGLFAYTVETGYEQPFQLNQHMRFRHSKEYLISLAKTFSFQVIAIENMCFRKQHKKEVGGYMVLLKLSS